MEKKEKTNLRTPIKIAIIGSVAVVGLVGAVGLTYAATQIASGNYPLIIQNLAKKFNTTPDKVQEVFNNTKEQQIENRLDQAVKNGTITSAQKALIISKQKELKTQIDKIDNQKLTQDERHTAMQKIKQDLQTWATKNNIPLGLIRGGMMGRGGRGMGMGRGEGMGMMEVE